MQEANPYENAKPMYLVDDIDNPEVLRNIVLDTCKDLKKQNDRKIKILGKVCKAFLQAFSFDSIKFLQKGKYLTKKCILSFLSNILYD